MFRKSKIHGATRNKRAFHLSALIGLGLLMLAWSLPQKSVLDTLEVGTPELQSIGALAFGPENVLFIGDAQSAAVFAVDVDDQDVDNGTDPIDIHQIDKQIAALLGTERDEIRINDMAVHPASQHVYLSVTRGLGEGAASVLLRVKKEGVLEEVSLEDVRFSKGMITNAPGPADKDRRGRSLRASTITDLAYADGKVYVAGLSNEEFASNFRQLAFPFQTDMTASSLEIYHVAHEQYETHAPVRTFMPYTLDGEAHILAAYTCTPLVAFPIDDLKQGAHVKGRTVAELGAGNTPLDIIAMEKEGKTHILIANTNRTMMKIDAEELAGAENLTGPEKDRFGFAGVPYFSLPFVGVLQLDVLNEDHFIFLQRNSVDGTLRLRSGPKRWL